MSVFPMSADTIHNTNTAGSELTVRQLMLMTSNVSVVLVGPGIVQLTSGSTHRLVGPVL